MYYIDSQVYRHTIDELQKEAYTTPTSIRYNPQTEYLPYPNPTSLVYPSEKRRAIEIQSRIKASDIRTQLIIFHTRIHLLSRSLQELSPLQPDPDADHGEIAFAGAFQQSAAPALGAELAEDWKGASEVSIRIFMYV